MHFNPSPERRPERMPAQRVCGCPLQLSLVGLAVLMLELIILDLFLNQAIPAVPAAGLHLAVTMGLGLWVCTSKRAREDLRLPLLLLATTAFMGPIGTGGSLVSLALGLWYSRSSTSFEDWYAALFPEEKSRLNLELFEQLNSASDSDEGVSSVAPFKDILAFGDPEQKRMVITLITEQFRPAFAPALLLALKDGNNAIRVQAATAMTRVESDFLIWNMELSNAVVEEPDNPELWWALARHYDDYAFTGILDAGREEDNRRKALRAYRRYLDLKPADPEACFCLARLLLRLREYQEAADLLAKTERSGSSGSQMILWYLESLFRLGRFQQLRQVAEAEYEQLQTRQELPIQAIDAVKLWANPQLAED